MPVQRVSLVGQWFKMKYITIPIRCGETVCKSAAYEECNFMEMIQGHAFCKIWGEHLIGEYVNMDSAGFYQPKRCEECRKAENEHPY